ncbi:MAG: hypothetical protein KDA91_21075, partial [Planctomycetaceae bacterium]|nr:hypothetical protein [Planctomycetaceae bacterium]
MPYSGPEMPFSCRSVTLASMPWDCDDDVDDDDVDVDVDVDDPLRFSPEGLQKLAGGRRRAAHHRSPAHNRPHPEG